MADFVAGDLTGHTIDVTCPGPEYTVKIHDEASETRISNVATLTVSWDGTYPLTATLTLEAAGT